MYHTSIMTILVTKVERKPNVTGESPTFKYDQTKTGVKQIIKPKNNG